MLSEVFNATHYNLNGIQFFYDMTTLQLLQYKARIVVTIYYKT